LLKTMPKRFQWYENRRSVGQGCIPPSLTHFYLDPLYGKWRLMKIDEIDFVLPF